MLGACAVVGAGAGILGSAGAATSGAATHSSKARTTAGRGLLKRAVHVDAVVPAGGGRFATVTIDRGVVVSVTGDQLVLREGTRKTAFKTVTLTVPAAAIVHDNRALSTLSAVKPGQIARVFAGPRQTRVNAHDRKVA